MNEQVMVKGKTVLKLVNNLIHAERVLNREPDMVIMSEAMAEMLIYELEGNVYDKNRARKAIGSKLLRLDVVISTNKNLQYLEVFETMRHAK
jgi:uncharacterized protein YbcI